MDEMTNETMSKYNAKLKNLICYIKPEYLNAVPRCFSRYNMVIIRNTDSVKPMVERVAPNADGSRIMTAVEWDWLDIPDSTVTEGSMYDTIYKCTCRYLWSEDFSPHDSFVEILRGFLQCKCDATDDYQTMKMDNENGNSCFHKVDAEKYERFKAQSKECMSKLCAQIATLEKIAAKRSVDYTQPDVEKMFAYMEKKLADCKATFMAHFDEEEEAKNNFDFEF